MRDFPHKITWWSSIPGDYGGYTWGSPITLDGRWEDRSETFKHPSGNDVVSNSIVYLADASAGMLVAPGDYLFHGTNATSDPTLVPKTMPVQRIDRTPDLRGLTTEIKAYL